MKIVADFHIHSKYSRACSKILELNNIETTCRQKGIQLIGTGDFTYPAWQKSIENELEEIANTGLFKLKEALDDQVRFILTTEVSLVYKKNDKCRRIHIVIHAPNLESIQELNKQLDKDYNIRSDGRPILGMSTEKLMKLLFSISPDFLVYPAHIWTPWYAVFGSKSGFDSMKECFGDWTDHVFAYETGLSSDPEMNWRLSGLDKLTMLSNSDAHSLPNLAREANVFELKEASYQEINQVIKNNANSSNAKDNQSYLDYTIEFYPEEGMYHYDGHRSCDISLHPDETNKNKKICPKCGKPLIIGVMNRVDELADRKEGYKSENKPGFKKLVELDKIIAESIGVKSRNSKKVQEIYQNTLEMLNSTELDILLNVNTDDIAKISGKTLAEGIKRVRNGQLHIKPGYDGVYGEVKIFNAEEIKNQKQLF
ncbi:DNA helicase UvrD [Candidatus Parcubacteria bacterium]|nr:MAG: DNA helicase UvrD [Candidatus Parcubacteria bacterium]